MAQHIRSHSPCSFHRHRLDERAKLSEVVVMQLRASSILCNGTSWLFPQVESIQADERSSSKIYKGVHDVNLWLLRTDTVDGMFFVSQEI